MKVKVLTRFLIGSSLGVVIIAPTITMTSCASVSQWTLPVNIGGVGDLSPWSDSWNKPNIPNLTDSKGYTYATTGNYSSPAFNFKSYLPNNYIAYTDRSGNSANYAYAKPYDDRNWNQNDDPSFFDYQWINTSNTDPLKYSESFNLDTNDGKKNVSVATSIENLNLYFSLSFTSIASAINVYNSGLLRLMTEDGVLNNKNGNDVWYNQFFSELNHGDKSSDANKQFYEFLFDMLDNLSQGKFKAKFGQSGANFKFASNKFGPGPYISYQNEDDTVETFYDPLKTFRSNNSFLESDIAKDTSSTDVISGGSLSPKFIFNNQTSPNNIPSVAGAYTAYAIPSTTKVDTTNLDNNKFYPAIVSTPIPFIVTPAASTYSYYNPLTKHSYQQNDYLLDDISSVQNQINSTNAWSNFSKHVDTSKDSKYADKKTWANSLSYSFDTSNHLNSIPKSSFYKEAGAGSTSSNLLDVLDKNKATYLEPSVSLLFDNTNYNSIQPNSYIAFANYSFIPFPKLDVTSNIVYDFMPVFNGITTNSNTGVPAVFPVSLLFESQDTPGAMSNFDTNLFKASLMPEADVLYNYQQSNNKETPYKTDDFKNNPNNKMWYFDLDKIFDKQSKAYGFFDKKIDLNKTPQDYFSDNKDAFQTLWNLFINWQFESDTWKNDSTDSTKVFIPLTK